jgi:hypothetical protein
MIWPRLPCGAGTWRGMRVAEAALVLLLLAAPDRFAMADDDPFSATVTIDSTSDTVAKARDLARIDGQRRALTAVVERLTGGPGKAKMPKLSDNQITDLVASFEVANEKMSAVRYVADYTFHFRAGDVRNMLQNAGIAITESNPAAGPGTAPGDTGVKSIVALPVLQTGEGIALWEDPNPWRQAWTQRTAGSGGARLMVPAGDAGDIAAINADRARAGDGGAIAAIARKYGADEVLVMLAVQRADGDPGGLDVTVKRFRLGQLVDTHADAIDANPGEASAALFRRAVDTIAKDIDSGWKNVKEPGSGTQSGLVATLPINGLDDWLKLRDRIAALTSIRKIDVKSLSRQEAVIEIQYAGTLDQLKASLAGISLDLQGSAPNWRLTRSGGER